MGFKNSEQANFYVRIQCFYMETLFFFFKDVFRKIKKKENTSSFKTWISRMGIYGYCVLNCLPIVKNVKYDIVYFYKKCRLDVLTT